MDAANVDAAVREAHISVLKDKFREPGQTGWDESGLKQIGRLYDIAKEFDGENPVGWIDLFDRSHPRDLEIGSEGTRLAKILSFADLYLKDRKTGDKAAGVKKLFRDF
jgi:hypothetical protein